MHIYTRLTIVIGGGMVFSTFIIKLQFKTGKIYNASCKKINTMKKSIVFILVGCLFIGNASAQRVHADTLAVSILDRMSAMIGELASCSVVIHSNYDVSSQELGLVKHSDVEHLYIGGPDKLLLQSDGDKGDRHIIYDGKKLNYYSVDKNHYSQTDVPPTVMEMIDHMNKTYGIVFPVADFLYPGFVDDILEQSTRLEMLGSTKVNGKDCFHIAGTTKEMTYQFWIADDAFSLPMKMVIVYTSKPMNPQFEATYTDWQINPSLPNGIFEFRVPMNAKKIKLSPLSAKK